MQTEVLERCDNCRKDIPESKIGTHLSYCRRNIKSCGTCGELYDINFEEEHAQEFHKKTPCPHCKAQFTATDLATHEGRCTKEPKFCEYCEMNVPKDGFDAHFKQCEAMTRSCDKCQAYIMNKDFLLHSLQCKGRVQPINKYQGRVQPINKYQHRVQPTNKYQHRVQPTNKYQHRVQPINKYQHRVQPTNKYQHRVSKDDLIKRVEPNGSRGSVMRSSPKVQTSKMQSKGVNDSRGDYRMGIDRIEHKAQKITFAHRVQQEEYDYKGKIASREDASKRSIGQPSTVVGQAGKQTVLPSYNPVQEQFIRDKLNQGPRPARPTEINSNHQIYSVKPNYFPKTKQVMEQFKRNQEKKVQDHKIKYQEPKGYQRKGVQQKPYQKKIYNQIGNQPKQPQPQSFKSFESYDRSRNLKPTSYKMNEPIKQIQKKNLVQERRVYYPDNSSKSNEIKPTPYSIKPNAYQKKDRIDNGEVIRATDHHYSRDVQNFQNQDFENYFGLEEDQNLALAIEMSLKNSSPKRKSKEVDPLNESFTKQAAIYEDIQRKNRK